MNDYTLIQADARRLPLADESVDCVVTSPPYWGLRDYGLGDSGIGLEPIPDCLGWATGEPCGDCWVCHMVEVFREVRRVLRPWGTVWLNLGDAYSDGTRNTKTFRRDRADILPTGFRVPGLGPKNLIGLPWRAAFALQADGWYLRSDIIWHKPNPMPESIADRPTKAHEYFFLLTRSKQYFYDGTAISEPAVSDHPSGNGFVRSHRLSMGGRGSQDQWDAVGKSRNKRTVWTIASCPRPEAHFATFPPALVEPCILAGTSAKGVCPKCSRPWARTTERTFHLQEDVSKERSVRGAPGQKPMDAANSWGGVPRGSTSVTTLGWEPTCSCQAGEPKPAVVLDPFVGSGTVCRVALRLGRRAVGVDRSFSYLKDIAQPFIEKPLQVDLLTRGAA